MPMSAKAAGAGLPQLDISTWPSQLFWLVVLFAAGYILMAKVVTPRIGTVLEERRAKLDDDLGKARTANEDATRIRAEYEAELDAARTAAAETARQATAEAVKRAEAGDAKIAKRLSEKVAKAEAKLAKAHSEAMANLNTVAAEAAAAYSGYTKALHFGRQWRVFEGPSSPDFFCEVLLRDRRVQVRVEHRRVHPAVVCPPCFWSDLCPHQLKKGILTIMACDVAIHEH